MFFLPAPKEHGGSHAIARPVPCWRQFGLPAVVAAADGPPIREETDLVFGKGGDADLKLDLAMPADGDGPFPAVVCIHGGGWVGGDRKDMANTIRALARSRLRGRVAGLPPGAAGPLPRPGRGLQGGRALAAGQRRRL